MQIKCTQCAADVTVQQDETFIECPFCASALFLDKRKVVFHYIINSNFKPNEAEGNLKRWMAGNHTVKDLDIKATMLKNDFYYFPVWYFKTKDASGDKIHLQPAASTSVSEIKKLQIPAGGNEVSFTELSVLNREMLFANTNLLYGVESAEIYEPLMSRRMARVVALTGSNLVWFGSVLAAESGTPQDKAAKLETRKNILNFLNIRYIISAYPFDDSVFPKIFETTILPPYNIPIGVYENASARPRFYFASSLETILQASPSGNSLEDEIAAFEKLKTIPEEGLGVFIECPINEARSMNHESRINPCGESGFMVSGKGEVEVVSKKNTVSILKIKSETPQFLVFSENHLPGWKAYIDNRETPIYTTGSVYMGVAIPEGEHKVRFEFTYSAIIKAFIGRYFSL